MRNVLKVTILFAEVVVGGQHPAHALHEELAKHRETTHTPTLHQTHNNENNHHENDPEHQGEHPRESRSDGRHQPPGGRHTPTRSAKLEEKTTDEEYDIWQHTLAEIQQKLIPHDRSKQPSSISEQYHLTYQIS